MMAKDTEVAQALATAIGREEEAHRFYSDVAARAGNPAVKETFLALAKDELGHKTFLEGARQDLRLLDKLPAVPDYKVAEATAQPTLSVEMKPADAFALAMKKEEEAARFYEGLAESAKDPQLRAMFGNLARMELGHKSRMESLFVAVGYPEAF